MNFEVDEFGRPISTRSRAPPTQPPESPAPPPLSGAVRKTNTEQDSRYPTNRQDDDSDSFSDVEVVDGEQATEDITKPLVVPLQSSSASSAGPTLLLEDRRVTPSAATKSFLDLVSTIPQRQRSMVIVGALHHGKTGFCSMLGSPDAVTVPYRQRSDEIDRQITIKSHTTSVLISGHSLRTSSSVLATLIDTPGHPDLAAELPGALRLADAAIVCIDCVEGVLSHTERVIRAAVLERLPLLLVITKVDRLIMDLRLPPMDAYRKLKGIVDACNNVIASCGSFAPLVSPVHGTVIFASSKLHFCFTLETFSARYLRSARIPDRVCTPHTFASRLWGSYSFDRSSGAFLKHTDASAKPSFVEYILEPLYKVVAHAVTGKAAESLHNHCLDSEVPSPLAAVREAVRHYFGDPHEECTSAVLNVAPTCKPRLQALAEQCRANGLLGTVAICPLVRSQNESVRYCVIRVLHGQLKRNSPVAFLDEHAPAYEPYFVSTFDELLLKTPEGLVAVDCAYEGQIVYATGGSAPEKSTGNAILFQSTEGAVDESNPDTYDALNALRPLPLRVPSPCVRVSVEPVEPSKMARVRAAMQITQRTTPGLDVRNEETGEFTIAGYGEVHLDSALRDLRSVLLRGVDIKLSDPFVSFCETVSAPRGILAMAGDRGSAQVACVAGALDPRLGRRLEEEDNFMEQTSHGSGTLWTALRSEYHWDILEARGVIACGPSATKGSNLLINDLVDEDMHAALQETSSSIRSAVVQGFRNAMQSGPLCAEPVRNVKSSVIHLVAPSLLPPQSLKPVVRARVEAQIAMHMRQAVAQSLFGAELKLMEPVYEVEMIAVPWRMDAVREVLQLRRGGVISEVPIAATPLNIVRAHLPIMDSFGFETQLRMTTVGEVFCTASFDHWAVVPGDPLDCSVSLEPLEPARGFQLARDFVVKTRHRKGLSGDIQVPI